MGSEDIRRRLVPPLGWETAGLATAAVFLALVVALAGPAVSLVLGGILYCGGATLSLEKSWFPIFGFKFFCKFTYHFSIFTIIFCFFNA